MWSNRPYTFDRVVRIIFTFAALCALIYIIYILRDVLLPFCVACLIAYIIEPWVEMNGKILHIKSHTVNVIITTVEGLILLAIMCFIFVPIIEREFAELSVIFHKYVDNGHEYIDHLPATIHNFIHQHLNLKDIAEKIDNVDTTAALEKIWASITSGLDKILGLLGWGIAIIYVLFILLDFNKYKAKFYNMVPNRYMPYVREVVADLSWSMKRYFRNQALISFITGMLYMAGFSIVGIPMAVVIGLMCMVLFMVPYLVYVSLIPVTIMCFFKSVNTGVDFWTIWVECLAVYAFVECVSDFILTPKIMGKAMGLNPALIFLSLSIWGSLLGLLGMVIALPATTIISKWLNIGLTQWKNKENAKSEIPPESSSS